MPAALLKIDTSTAGIAAPYQHSVTPVLRSAKSMQRLRSSSSASASSQASSSHTIYSARYTPKGSLSTPATSLNFGPSTESASWSPTGSTEYDTERVSSDYVLAMHDFAPQHQNVTCLPFHAGQVIHVLNRDSSGWWDGELDGRRGWFPSNYVTADVGLLTEEELPHPRPGHAHGMSTTSASTWTSMPSTRERGYSRTDHRPLLADSLDPYCPPVMVPLLHGLSLLQNAVRLGRIAHFQPATAMIISCVRTILADTGCLPRDAPLLKQHASLASERKRILSDLAALVSQAKKSSQDMISENQRELEVDAMVRQGGQVFAHVRGFLAVAVQCGVELPSQGTRPPDSNSSETVHEVTLTDSARPTTPNGEYGRYWEMAAGRSTNGIVQRPRKDVVASPALVSRAKSMGDIRSRRKAATEIDKPPALPSGIRPSPRARRYVSEHHNQLSTSSQSSSSSFSSSESVATPPTPSFPYGPSTASEVLEALKHTHDHYLSTIAAFIGHAHSHSRSSHASSTGHMYDLVREVVEMVCKLLTIVEGVLKHPDIPGAKIVTLRVAKEGLYNVTSSLADSVRMLTTTPQEEASEEDEKAVLLRSATNALKAGSDCVNAVRKCLQRSTGERPFIIELPRAGELDAGAYTPRKFTHQTRESGPRLSKALSMHALRGLYEMNGVEGEEDLTIQAQTLTDIDVTVRLKANQDNSAEPQEAAPTLAAPATASASPGRKTLPPLRISVEQVVPDLPSPSSFVPTDDGTTWEGSLRNQPQPSLEEKLLNGDLPAVPRSSLSDFAQSDPMSWLLAHDHAPTDVAYNGDGQLVGATLAALVERMTPHDSLVEPPFAAVFFMTFRLFTTPAELVDAIIARYNIIPPPNISEGDMYTWQQRKGLPVRLRVSNFVKAWLESYWRPTLDNVVLSALQAFTRDALAVMFPNPSQRILELIQQWRNANESGLSPKVDRIRDAGILLNPPSVLPSEVPRPIMTKTLLASLRTRSYATVLVTDFDPLELARQFTMMESSLYCAIHPEEVLETGQEGAASPVNVKAVTSLSTVITGWVAESILNEVDTKRRTALVKFFIKVADRCASLQNFSTPRSILAALDSSTISRLHQTWTGLSQKTRLQLEQLRKLADHARNYHEYRSRLRNTAPPAVPFLGLYMTDITFCREGNPSHRTSPTAPDKKLINFNKYHKLARIVQDMQRFQVPYTFKTIPEVQEYLKDAFEKSKHRGDLQDLYRRSLLIEPKQPADTTPANDVRQLFGWASRSQQPTPTSAS